MGQGLRSIVGMTLAAWGGEGVSPGLMGFGVCPGRKLTWEDTALTPIFLYLQDHPVCVCGGGMLT